MNTLKAIFVQTRNITKYRRMPLAANNKRKEVEYFFAEQIPKVYIEIQ